jgi:PAS domain S-box-containing protein
MPGQNGIEFLEDVRDRDPDLPFILYTGKGSEAVASKAISAGVSDYLQKESGTEQYAILANRITNAVEARRAQRDRQRQLEAIETAQEGISLLDDDGTFLHVNEAYADLYGYDSAELVGKHWETLYNDEDARRLREEILPTVEAEGHWHGTTTGRRADGSTFTEDHILALTDQGELVCTVRDISQRKQRERELREEQEFVQSIFRSLPDPLYAFDVDGYPLRWNEQFETVSGYSSEEIEEMHVSEFVPEEELETILTDFQLIIGEGRTVTVETKIETKDGDWVPYELTGSPLEAADGQSRGMTGVGRDITVRKRREQRLEALNRATRQLLTAETREEVAEIGAEVAREVLDLEANAVHLYDDEQSSLAPVAVTDAGHDLVGDVPSFTDGDSIAWRVYEHGEALALDDVSDDPDIYNADTPVESELYLPIGEYGILMAGSPTAETFDDQDVLLGEILAGNLEAALEQVERTEQLRARERELTRQNERLEQFTSIVSHDLRNPLSVARGRLELATDECNSDHLDHVAQAHDRMETLIEDLLTLARDGGGVTDPVPVDLPTLIDNCWSNVKTGEATLVRNFDQRIRADESRLKQLFENLIRNAVEHGGDRVTVTIGRLEDGFYVEDDGTGIDEDQYERLFQTDYTTSDTGAGFGLTIVEEICEAHDWDIRVTASDDGGARFEISGVDVVRE